MTGIDTYSEAELIEAIDQDRRTLLVHFRTPLADGCQTVHRNLQELVPEFAERLPFAEHGVDLTELDLVRRFRVCQLPTLIFFHQGRATERLEQVLPAEELREILQSILSFYE